MDTKEVIKIEIRPHGDDSGVNIARVVKSTPTININPMVAGVATGVVTFAITFFHCTTVGEVAFALFGAICFAALMFFAFLTAKSLNPITITDVLYRRDLEEEEGDTHPWDYDILKQVCANHHNELMDIVDILEEQSNQKSATTKDKQEVDVIALRAIKTMHDSTLTGNQQLLDGYKEKMEAVCERIDIAQQLYRSGLEPSVVQKEIMDNYDKELRQCSQ